MACSDLFIKLGVKKDNLTMIDSKGVINFERKGLNKWKLKYAKKTKDKTLSDALKNADIFLGLSSAGILKKEMIKHMAKNPIIFACANPDPEILPESKEVYGESDHPDVDELYQRVSKLDSKISIATVYRTVKLFEESGILTKHDFKGGKARYETLVESHHDHLIDIKSGEIIEFVDEEIEKLQKKVAEKYGYKLVDHKLELYGIKKSK